MLSSVAANPTVKGTLALESSGMTKAKKKLTPARRRARKAAKAECQGKYEWLFMNGKQVRVKRPPTVEGIPVDQFIEETADPVWLHQNELWELVSVEDAGRPLPEPSAEQSGSESICRIDRHWP